MLGLIFEGQRVDHGIKIAREHIMQLMQGETDAMVGHPAVFEVVGSNLFAATAGADLGTGSGVIGLSLAGELPRGSTEVWLTDLSADALEVAGANLAGSGFINSDVRIAQGSWFAALPGELKNGFDLIVSNPPYISRIDTVVEKIVRDYEPDIALFAENDGMSAHEQIVTQAQE
ncbi:MAG: methyltransferase, partial [Actinomycetota bacterium]